MCESLHCLGQKRGGLIVLTLCFVFLLRIDYCGLRLLSLALFLEFRHIIDKVKVNNFLYQLILVKL